MIGYITYSSLLSILAEEELYYADRLNCIDRYKCSLESAENTITSILEDNRFKYLNICIIRNGLPCFHWKKPISKEDVNSIKPYVSTDSFKDCESILKEFDIWNKLRIKFDKELIFIYIKNLYEEDVIKYLSNNTYIENLLTDYNNTVILEPKNSTKLNYPFNIPMLDDLIHNI